MKNTIILATNDFRDKGKRKGIGFFLSNAGISENIKYTLSNEGSSYYGYGVFSKLNFNTLKTDSIYQSKLFIKYYDTIQRIVSGTFCFDAVNEDGEVVQFREGHFDM
ncbi:MAG: hypothetical protein M9958_10935 [Chitinophagales bacterium]|nr:hypothetical protein [Chitinophagales bacterium]